MTFETVSAEKVAALGGPMRVPATARDESA